MTTVRQGMTPRWFRVGKRRANLILCVHTTEGGPPSAAQGNAYDARRPDQVSAQWFIDPVEIVQEVAQPDVAFTMAPWNDVTSNAEVCGLAAWDTWDPRILDNLVFLMAAVWQGPLDVLTPERIIQSIDAGAVPSGISCHRWLNVVTKHYGATALGPLLGYSGSGNVDTSHTDPGDTLISLLPTLAARAAQLRGGPGPVPPPQHTGGKRVLTKLTVKDHWAVFYGDMDEQGIILEIHHAGPRLNDVYAPKAAQTLERTRESMRDFPVAAGTAARLPIADAPGIQPWTAADFYQGD